MLTFWTAREREDLLDRIQQARQEERNRREVDARRVRQAIKDSVDGRTTLLTQEERDRLAELRGGPYSSNRYTLGEQMVDRR